MYKDTATIFLKFSYINIVLNWLLLHISGYILKKMNIYGINNYFYKFLGISESRLCQKENFNKSLGQEKARVKLYKSGKTGLKASISEFELLRTMGVPF